MTPFIGCVYLYSLGRIYYKYTILNINTEDDRIDYHIATNLNTNGLMTDCKYSLWNYSILSPYQEYIIEHNSI
jgi:hypothetical protein